MGQWLFSGNVTAGGAVTINGAVATVGPSSAVSGNLASFNGTGGNILADSGFSAATLVVPTGTILEYAGASAPSGFLLANGQAVSRTTYATLYGICGTTYGVGDGSTTFNVPDRRGRVGAGYDPSNATGLLTGSTAQGASAAALGNSGGEQAHTQAGTEMVAHNHPASSSSSSSSVVTDPGHAHVAKFGNTPSGGSFPYTSTGAASGEVDVPTTATTTGVTVATTTTTTTTTSDTGGGNAFNVVQPTIILNYIIKT